jgi:hypothetical protein
MGDQGSEIGALQSVIDRRAAQFPQRHDQGAVNNVLGAVEGPVADLFLNAGTRISNVGTEAMNWGRRKLDPKAKPAPLDPDRPPLVPIDQLPPGCSEQAEASYAALKADPQFAGWEIERVTRHSRFGEGREALPLSGYHHKVFARSPTGQAYSVDMHKGREIRPWSADDNDFTLDRAPTKRPMEFPTAPHERRAGNPALGLVRQQSTAGAEPTTAVQSASAPCLTCTPGSAQPAAGGPQALWSPALRPTAR